MLAMSGLQNIRQWRTISVAMIIIETSIFTKQVRTLFTDDEYRLLQSELVVKPDLGKIIRHSGGIRKIRWSASGRGKRGGARVIYYWATADDQLLMLFIYPKNVSDTLSSKQLAILRKIVEEDYP